MCIDNNDDCIYNWDDCINSWVLIPTFEYMVNRLEPIHKLSDEPRVNIFIEPNLIVKKNCKRKNPYLLNNEIFIPNKKTEIDEDSNFQFPTPPPSITHEFKTESEYKNNYSIDDNFNVDKFGNFNGSINMETNKNAIENFNVQNYQMEMFNDVPEASEIETREMKELFENVMKYNRSIPPPPPLPTIQSETIQSSNIIQDISNIKLKPTTINKASTSKPTLFGSMMDKINIVYENTSINDDITSESSNGFNEPFILNDQLLENQKNLLKPVQKNNENNTKNESNILTRTIKQRRIARSMASSESSV